MSTRNSHCSYCGAPFAPDAPWPRTCGGCRQTSYVNPVPVAVAIVPVDGGVLAIRRAIRPAGQLALPGGFIDLGESWQAAAAREVREETGVVIDEAGIEAFAVKSAPDGTLLVFGVARPLTAAELPPFAATAETAERLVLRAPQALAFPLHTDVLRAYFATREAPVG